MRLWQVGALCKAISSSLESQFNPVRVGGEISGFVRAASGHCYFNLKDATGQIRCAAFKRVASAFDFSPRDGDQVELQGRLGVYEQRGELQLVVEAMRRAGQGVLFERFVQIKARLQAQGLFDAQRKRPLPNLVRGIGVVTSLGAAALHDVLSALQRRVPHIPVTVVPAAVQGEAAPQALCAALQKIYRLQDTAHGPIDVILLVRGGGSMEDLWAFNDEQLARAIVASGVPVVTGVGHETDFTIADFCADLRAPTPTAAAELCALSQAESIERVTQLQKRIQNSVRLKIDKNSQRLDFAQSRLVRPSTLVPSQVLKLTRLEQQLAQRTSTYIRTRQLGLITNKNDLEISFGYTMQNNRQRLRCAQIGLELLDPKLVLQRGFAWLSNTQGDPVVSVSQVRDAQHVVATLADGVVNLTVLGT